MRLETIQQTAFLAAVMYEKPQQSNKPIQNIQDLVNKITTQQKTIKYL